MKIVCEEHKGHYATGRKMHEIIRNYHHDLGSFALVPLKFFFDWVRKIPYVNDSKVFNNYDDEILARPSFLVDSRFYGRYGLDCKKKSILICSYLRNRGIPYRLLAVSENEDKKVHHVFPQAKLSGRWENLDATYSTNKIFEPYPSITFAEVI